MPELSERELTRYQRQIMLPGWGTAGQERLKATTIGVVGAGGLGSTILVQLAAAGFGKIVFADGDRVELGNLNRQVVHREEDIGRPKADSAREKLERQNTGVRVTAIAERIDERNIAAAFAGVDAVVDALDSLESRFVVNRYAVTRRIPFFHGAVWGLEGRVMTVIPGRGPCLECLYPAGVPRETPPVVGVAPAVVGALQVAEAIKHFVGLGRVLSDTLLVCDLETMEFTRLAARRNPDCPACATLA